jgi:hypothetical protein
MGVFAYLGRERIRGFLGKNDLIIGWFSSEPAPKKGAVDSPKSLPGAPVQAEVDVAQLDSGLGIGLSIFGSYKELLAATSGWGFEWKLTATGGGTLRLSAPGLLVYTEDGKISGWRLDLKKVFADEHWKNWWPSLRQAGLDPQRKVAEQTRPQQDLNSDAGVRSAQGWLYPAYELHYLDGKLSEVRGGIRLGEGGIAPPTDTARPAGQGG